MRFKIVRDDRNFTLFLGDHDLGYYSYDEHAWAGLEAVEDLAIQITKILSLEPIMEEELGEESD